LRWLKSYSLWIEVLRGWGGEGLGGLQGRVTGHKKCSPPRPSTGSCCIRILFAWGLRFIAETKTVMKCRYRVANNRTALLLTNGIFWDVTPCGSCKNRRLGET
jgi:hypothetical protein